MVLCEKNLVSPKPISCGLQGHRAQGGGIGVHGLGTVQVRCRETTGDPAAWPSSHPV